MKTKTFFALPLIALLMASTAPAGGPASAEQAPDAPGITKVKPGTKIKDIQSDPFAMKKATIEGGQMKIEVGYAGGAEEHEFKLYWNGIVARSYPGKTHVYLKHDANGDGAEAYITRTLVFDLAEMNKPMIITVNTDHGDKATVQYGEAKRD